MKYWVIVLAVTAGLAAGAQESARTLNLQEYAAELQQLENQVQQLSTEPQKAEELRRSLPETWTVADREQRVNVSTDFVRSALTDFQKSPPDRKRVLLDALQRRLAAMRDASGGFAQPDGADAATRARLQEILSAREFRFVRPPSIWEIWRDKAFAWLDRWWNRTMRKVPNVPGLGRTLVWMSIAFAACALAIWFYRTSQRRPAERAREILPFSPSSKSWLAWLRDAEEAAAGAEWRDAVHLAYWAAVSYLESGGAWRPDKTRTPREYLRALGSSHPSKNIFTAMTRRFESVWYGGRPAGAAEFQSARSELRELGCR